MFYKFIETLRTHIQYTFHPDNYHIRLSEMKTWSNLYILWMTVVVVHCDDSKPRCNLGISASLIIILNIVFRHGLFEKTWCMIRGMISRSSIACPVSTVHFKQLCLIEGAVKASWVYLGKTWGVMSDISTALLSLWGNAHFPHTSNATVYTAS